ncbi:MAG: MBOAT family O-acyltransferase [Candidatus Zixiibacteriota bacterium]
MLFNSLQYLIFFPLVVAIYFSIPHKYRWAMLLAASYYFYMCWKAEYIILIIVSTLIDYFAGIQMGKKSNKKSRKLYLLLSLFSNLGLLFAFKYFNFFSDSMREIFHTFNLFYNMPLFNVLLPVGISFYTFQTLSYTIDIYMGKREPERNLGIFALYVSFFPQLVAGPIERSTRLMPQFFEKHNFEYQRVADGLKLMLWGFFKKVVIADSAAVVVNQIYNNPHDYTGLPIWIATYLFAIQIYCDFSGYSDIAIGSAQVMGFKLMDNFRIPYYSKSISEFWKRWHISLSTWFRDYLYIPLGGNRVSKLRWYPNLMITFVVSGLWHGANWTFVIWGGLYGTYLILSILTEKFRTGIYERLKISQTGFGARLFKMFVTFHLVCFAWIFFRANSVGDAFYLISNLFTNLEFKLGGYYLGLPRFDLFTLIIAIMMMEAVHLVQRKADFRIVLSAKPQWVRWSFYYATIICIIFLGAFNNSSQFIYFQF